MIVDTNALSAMADGDPKLEPLLRRASLIALPAIVLGEYRYGIGQSRNRAQYEHWLSGLIPDCRVLPVDQDTATHYASIRGELKELGRPIPGNDLWIAALAIQHGFAVISHDRHFDFVRKLKRHGW